jgi:2,4-dienoyl-CoA reductase-like NADH-dependent reductase (Old Yellow Enzyme family)
LAEHSGAHQDSRPGTRRGSDSARRVSEQATRAANPDGKPVLFRLTATDWGEGGITIEESALFAKELVAAGIDLLDVSSGLGVRDEEARPSVREAVHVVLGNTLREASGLPIASVGQIGELPSAYALVADGRTVAVMLGRALLRGDPYLALRGRASDRTGPPGLSNTTAPVIPPA